MLKKERKKYELSLVMDASRSDVDFLGHETTTDNFGHTNLVLTRTERNEFLKYNSLEVQPQVDEQMDDVIGHICRGNTVYGQIWNSSTHKKVWMEKYAEAY